MLPNLALIVFCSLIAWLLYRFPLRKATISADYQKLFPFFCALIGFVLFNGLLAYLGLSYLQAKQPVTIVGFVENNLELISGNKSQTIRADIIYAGAYDDFTARARVQLILATALVWANAFVALVLVIFPLRDCLKGMKGWLVSSKEKKAKGKGVFDPHQQILAFIRQRATTRLFVAI
jgi:hypothetical protein